MPTMASSLLLTSPGPLVLTAPELARLLALSPRTVYKRAWQERVGLIPIRVGRSLRFSAGAVEALLRAEDDRWLEVHRRRRERSQLRRWARHHGIPWGPAGDEILEE